MERYETLKLQNIGTPCVYCGTKLTADHYGSNLARGGGECAECEYKSWRGTIRSLAAPQG